MTLFEQSRTCSQCGNEESRLLPAQIAAFEERKQWNSPCERCSSNHFLSVGNYLPPLDSDLLDEWCHDPDLCFSEQDEDLYLAAFGTLPLLQTFVQRRDILESKRGILLASICVPISHGILDDDVSATVVDFLSRNLSLFNEISDRYLPPYIKRRLLPQIRQRSSGETGCGGPET